MRKSTGKSRPAATEANYNRLVKLAQERADQAKEAKDRGDMTTADALLAAARAATRQAEEMGRRLGKRPQPVKKTGTQRKRSGAKKAPTATRYQALLNGMANFLGVSAADILQHVTTDTELKARIQSLKNKYIKAGELDKKGYCKALNEYRDNMLFTAGELEKAIQEARKEGNNGVIPGYETAAKQYRSHAGIIAAEIRKNGGTVN